MSSTEALSREDVFFRTSKRLQLWCIGAFGLWQIADLGREVASRGVQVASALVAVAAGLAWTALLLVLMKRARTARNDPLLRAAFEDERARDVRLRAYRAGFWVASASAALLGVPAAAHVIPAIAVTKLILVATLTAFIVSFVILDGE
jgi:hypothetical protein